MVSYHACYGKGTAIVSSSFHFTLTPTLSIVSLKSTFTPNKHPLLTCSIVKSRRESECELTITCPGESIIISSSWPPYSRASAVASFLLLTVGACARHLSRDPRPRGYHYLPHYNCEMLLRF